MSELRWIRKKTKYGELMLQQKVGGEWVDTQLVEEEEPKKLLWEKLREAFPRQDIHPDVLKHLSQTAVEAVCEVVDELPLTEAGREVIGVNRDELKRRLRQLL